MMMLTVVAANALQCEHAGKVPKGATGNLSVRFVPDQVRVACACVSLHLRALANFYTTLVHVCDDSGQRTS